MPSAVAAPTRIFEDADADAAADAKASRAIKGHARTPSVGEFLRGRRHKENDASKVRTTTSATRASEKPLGERHINSPPQPRRVLLKDDISQPTVHKKSKSSISLKSLVKDKSSDSGRMGSCDDGTVENRKPKKTKSSTNLASLLRKKSKKNLNGDLAKGQENTSPPSSANLDTARSPIWSQFATQPLEDHHGRLHYPPEKRRTVQQEIDLYRTKEPAEHPASTENAYPEAPILAEKPPQRPFLEHRSSRSSIFKEDLGGLDEAHCDEKQTQRPAHGEVRATPEPKPSHHRQLSDNSDKRTSKVLAAIGTLNFRSRQQQALSTPQDHPDEFRPMSEEEISSALEALLDARNIAPNMRNQMRALDPRMKLKLIQNQRGGSGSSTSSTATPTRAEADKRDSRSSNRPRSRDEEDLKEAKPSRSRPRSRAFTLTKRDDAASPSKKPKRDDSPTGSRSKPRPKSVDISSSSSLLSSSMRPNSSRSPKSSTSISSLFSSSSPSRPDAAAIPGDFIHYLREVEKPELVEIGKMHKLRILLRNESIAWTDTFVKSGGMDEVVKLLYRIIRVEWREEHEDTLLHETLLCLKGLCTTSLALQRLAEIEAELFPKLLAMLFDAERKGPSEFGTRTIILSLLFAHLSAALPTDGATLAARARTIFNYLKDPAPEDAKKPFDFIEVMHVKRPYRTWCKEVVNVTKEVFWIFLHHLNVIPFINADMTNTYCRDDDDDDDGDRNGPDRSFTTRHFPPPRPPHPAAPYVGGVEWEATSYLAVHLDLLNGLLASLPTRDERNAVREEMRASGWEKVMGGTMRTCKEKFYGGVHEGLKVWVGAGRGDGWLVEDVRAGPSRETGSGSPRKGGGGSPVKRKGEEKEEEKEAPRIKLDVGGGAFGGW